MFLRTIADLIRNSIFTRPPALAFANSSQADTIQADGFWIGRRKRGGRFVLYPDGQLRQVDRDFDPAVFDDPDSLPKDAKQAQADDNVIAVPDVEPATDTVQAISQAMLQSRPDSLVAVAHNSKGEVIAAIITPASRGLTSAAFRVSFRSLPAKTKGVTFAAHRDVSREVREATMQAADSFLVRVLDFIVAD